MKRKVSEALLELLRSIPENEPEEIKILYRIMIRDLFFTFNIPTMLPCQCGCGELVGCTRSANLYALYSLQHCKKPFDSFENISRRKDLVIPVIQTELTFEKFKKKLVFALLKGGKNDG